MVGFNITVFPTTFIYDDNVTLVEENDVRTLAKSYMMYKIGGCCSLTSLQNTKWEKVETSAVTNIIKIKPKIVNVNLCKS